MANVQSVANSGRSGATRPRILVAEDDHEMRKLVAWSLASAGYEVHEAADGGRLLARLTANLVRPDGAFDLVITDVRMPVCSGIHILRGLRAAHWKVPVILMTGFSDASTRAQAAQLHAVLFDKPFALEDLRDAVTSLLRSH